MINKPVLTRMMSHSSSRGSHFEDADDIKWDEIELADTIWEVGDICQILHKNMIGRVIGLDGDKITIETDYEGVESHQDVYSEEIEKVEPPFEIGDRVRITSQPCDVMFLAHKIPLTKGKIKKIKWHDDNFKPNGQSVPYSPQYIALVKIYTPREKEYWIPVSQLVGENYEELQVNDYVELHFSYVQERGVGQFQVGKVRDIGDEIKIEWGDKILTVPRQYVEKVERQKIEFKCPKKIILYEGGRWVSGNVLDIHVDGSLLITRHSNNTMTRYFPRTLCVI